MAIAHDVSTVGADYSSTGTQTTSHVASASARAAVVLIEQNGTATDEVSGVTYGGVAMRRLGFQTEPTEAGAVYVYFLDKVSTGTQNVAMTTTAATIKTLTVSTITVASGKVVTYVNSEVGISASIANPSTSVSVPSSSESYLFFYVIHSGLQTMTTTPGSGLTNIKNADRGSQGYGMARGVFTGATSHTIGWTAATADDYCSIAIGFAETATSIPHRDLTGAIATNGPVSLTTTQNVTPQFPPTVGIVYVAVERLSATNTFTSVKYGGVSLTKLIEKQDSTENGNVTIWYLNSGIPSGSQDFVVVSSSATATSIGRARFYYSMTVGDTAIGVPLSDGNNSASTTDLATSVTLTNGVTFVLIGGAFSGLDTVNTTNLPGKTGWVGPSAITDSGTDGSAIHMSMDGVPPNLPYIEGTGAAYTGFGWTQAADDAAWAVAAVRIAPGLTTVVSSRATTWRTMKAIASSRPTTWDTLKDIVSSRPTTWDVLTPVVSARPTTWKTKQAVVSSRPTTWRTLERVTSSRPTTWNVLGNLVTVISSRSTTWRTMQAIPSVRPTTWKTRQAIVSARPTTWDVLTPVVSARPTTWDVLTPVVSARPTTWKVKQTVTSGRPTTWRTMLRVTSTRPTTWRTLFRATSSRQTTWKTFARVTSSRVTTWNVNGRVISSRVTTWDVLTVVTSSRDTTWRVLAPVTVVRVTSWRTLQQVTSQRQASWNVYYTVILPSTDFVGVLPL